MARRRRKWRGPTKKSVVAASGEGASNPVRGVKTDLFSAVERELREADALVLHVQEVFLSQVSKICGGEKDWHKGLMLNHPPYSRLVASLCGVRSSEPECFWVFPLQGCFPHSRRIAEGNLSKVTNGKIFHLVCVNDLRSLEGLSNYLLGAVHLFTTDKPRLCFYRYGKLVREVSLQEQEVEAEAGEGLV